MVLCFSRQPEQPAVAARFRAVFLAFLQNFAASAVLRSHTTDATSWRAALAKSEPASVQNSEKGKHFSYFTKISAASLLRENILCCGAYEKEKHIMQPARWPQLLTCRIANTLSVTLRPDARNLL
jgi:hypothetical protein